MRLVRLAVVVVALVAAGVGLSAQSYVPNRVFDSARGQFSDFESMVATLAKADVVFVGEQHDDPNTHRLERAILEGLALRRSGLILSLEMFERDVQDRVEQFRLGHLSETQFLATSRPWPRYATDYKPLVDFAIDNKWPIVAANIPRPIASEIAKTGLDVLRDKAAPDSTWFAKEALCPTDDEYFKRFKEVMGTHANAEQVQLYYASQCLKDETMAESIVRAWQAAAAATPGTRPLAVHYNGAFHSDSGLGTASRVQRRLPNARTVVVSVVPVKSLDDLTPDEHKGKGDYVIFTIKSEAVAK
jgi:uncharacterized iron-regulated protein